MDRRTPDNRGDEESAGDGSPVRETPVEKPKVTNRFSFWIDLARAIDSWRIFPRIFISVYLWIFIESSMWFMSLDAPSVEQAGLISVVTGIGAAWFASYTSTKGDGN